MKLAVVLLLVVATPAWGQSKRYPPAPVDKDAEAETRSKLWDKAITPERSPYQDLIREATAALSERTSDSTITAVKKLDAAIQLLPNEPDAYQLRGEAYLELKHWDGCATDLAQANAKTKVNDLSPRQLAELRRKLGLCQARAGKLAEAEKTLAETAAAGNGSGELWMRLGEVRIAMGKLDEAIAALESAIEATDVSQQAMIHFLLAAAYDRARRPALALDHASLGAASDQNLSTLENPVLPLIGAGEKEYLMGLAWAAHEPPHPERALAYFRGFAKLAPDSPWRKRADEHIKQLKSADFPDAITHTGTAPLDDKAALAAIRKAMPQLRACMAKFPSAVVGVEITKSGPRTPPTDRFRPRFNAPPEGVAVRPQIGEVSMAQIDAIERCIDPIASRIAVPAIKDRDAFYRLAFDVVAP